jgi:carbon monoxide dehydrogenase subunit G
MELTGSVPSQAGRQQVWDALMNADYWKEAIPDAEKFELVGDNLYEMVVKVDIGPIKGHQTVNIQFSDLEPPNSCNFELQNSMIKSAKGLLTLKDPAAFSSEDGETPPPEGTVTLLAYRLEVDAGNPLFNAVLESFKGKIKEGLEEMLGRLEAKAH